MISNEKEEKILDYIQSNQNRITTKEAESLLDLGERRSREIVSEMVDKGILERVGRTTNTHYRLKNTEDQ